MANDSIFPTSGISAERAETILDLLQLNFGEGYGRRFFSRRYREILAKALDQHRACKSFAELIRAIEGSVRAGEDLCDAAVVLDRLRTMAQGQCA